MVCVMRRNIILIIFIACPVLYSIESIAMEITRGAMLSNSCAACHGTDGKSPGAIPSINGKSSQFLVSALHDFQDGKRPATVMGRHASGYTDKEIQDIANYFSSQN